jgi:tetratricopeptide (TPR) repeat protein
VIRALWLVLLCSACNAQDEPRTESSESPRGPLGAAAARCHGASDDPQELFDIEQRANGDLEGSIAAMEAFIGGHRGSSTARARLGELLLRTNPPRAREAEQWFSRALELSDRGCTLGHRDEWVALEGVAITRMLQGDYRGSIPWLRRALARWPTARKSRYNLACALCQTGDIEGCAHELEAVMRDEEQPHALVEFEQPVDYYAQSARQDPDLAPLRADAARFSRIVNR